jgi:hypothetical protein
MRSRAPVTSRTNIPTISKLRFPCKAATSPFAACNLGSGWGHPELTGKSFMLKCDGCG